MTKQQLMILGGLGGITLLVLSSLLAATWQLNSQIPAADAATAAALPLPATTPTALLPGATPTSPAATTTATPPPLPTPVSTRVVRTTVQPSPTPTRANCVRQVSNFGASGLLTDGDVIAYLQTTIPAEHLDHCRQIEYVPQVAANHGQTIVGNFIPIYREIYVYATYRDLQNTNSVLETLTHEIGHNVYFNLWRNDFDFDKQWDDLYQESLGTFSQAGLGFVSDYARTNRHEDFAESYRTYIRNPQLLQYYAPAKYEFMQQVVFNGRQYGAEQ